MAFKCPVALQLKFKYKYCQKAKKLHSCLFGGLGLHLYGLSQSKDKGNFRLLLLL